MSVQPNVISTKKTALTATHVTTYNQLTSSPQTPVTIAAATGQTLQATTEQLSLLVDEALAVAIRTPNTPLGKPTGSYQLS